MAPLRIALVNLMPDKRATEAQFARVLAVGSTPVELTLVLPDGYRSRHSTAEHLALYRRFSEIAGERFDGVIVTGAPVETLPFESVTYWRELTRIFDWARERVASLLCICWAAQAALYHFHGVSKHPLPAKKFGIYGHHVVRPQSPLMRGMGREFLTPVSRHTEVAAEALPQGVEVLAASDEAGLCILTDPANGLVCNFNHLEYDTGTLHREFLRDRQAGRPVPVPAHYYPKNDPQCAPVNSWRPFATRFFGNWLRELERKRPQSEDASEGLRWLIQRPLGLLGRDELRIEAAAHPDALVELLRVLAAAGLSPRSVQSQKLALNRQRLHLCLESVDQQRLASPVRQLLRSARFFRISYRSGDGVSGFTAVHPAKHHDRPQLERVAAAG